MTFGMRVLARILRHYRLRDTTIGDNHSFAGMLRIKGADISVEAQRYGFMGIELS